MFLYLSLFLIFLKIGGVSFGGGYAMLPFIEKEIIDTYHLLSATEFLDILAISQITPGPIAINAATFIGFKYLGFGGAAAATLGIITAPFIFMSLLNPFLNRFKNSTVFEEVFRFLRPITLGLILSAGASTMKKSLLDLPSILIFLAAGLLLWKTKLHPIVILLLFGLLGVVLKMFPF